MNEAKKPALNHSAVVTCPGAVDHAGRDGSIVRQPSDQVFDEAQGQSLQSVPFATFRGHVLAPGARVI